VGAEKLTKAEIIEQIYPKVRVSKKNIHTILDLFFGEVKSGLLEDRVIELRGFGTFEIKTRKGSQKPEDRRYRAGREPRGSGIPAGKRAEAESLVLEEVA
jgi:nucleoid DNA-binding protein